MSVSSLRIEGGCHCAAVRFVVRTSSLTALDCNCSICRKKGFLHLIVAAEDLEVLSGEDSLTDYRFNTRTARHLFCSICGTHPYYVPRSHPDGYSVNVRCLDEPWPDRFQITPFDGTKWEESIDDIR